MFKIALVLFTLTFSQIVKAQTKEEIISQLIDNLNNINNLYHETRNGGYISCEINDINETGFNCNLTIDERSISSNTKFISFNDKIFWGDICDVSVSWWPGQSQTKFITFIVKGSYPANCSQSGEGECNYNVTKIFFQILDDEINNEKYSNIKNLGEKLSVKNSCE